MELAITEISSINLGQMDNSFGSQNNYLVWLSRFIDTPELKLYFLFFLWGHNVAKPVRFIKMWLSSFKMFFFLVFFIVWDTDTCEKCVCICFCYQTSGTHIWNIKSDLTEFTWCCIKAYILLKHIRKTKTEDKISLKRNTTTSLVFY